MSTWHSIVSFTAQPSPAVWVALMIANIGLTITTWGVARRRVRRAGERAAHPDRFTDSNRKKDVALTVASLVPAVLFWGMVLAGSFQGLVASGRNVLEWNNGAEYLVPGTLDGVSVTFAFLAFRAIHKHRDPARCQRVVWAASLSSATVNFAYEYGFTHNVIAGFYLAALSVFGMVIFHEFLAQFEEGAEYIRRNKRPPWGLRWFTSSYSTFCGAVAWENFPPEDGTVATVRNGLANLERTRSIKAGRRDGTDRGTSRPGHGESQPPGGASTRKDRPHLRASFGDRRVGCRGQRGAGRRRTGAGQYAAYRGRFASVTAGAGGVNDPD